MRHRVILVALVLASVVAAEAFAQTATPTSTPTGGPTRGALFLRSECASPPCVSATPRITHQEHGHKTIHAEVPSGATVKVYCYTVGGYDDDGAQIGSNLTADGTIETDWWCKEIDASITAWTSGGVSVWVRNSEETE